MKRILILLVLIVCIVGCSKSDVTLQQGLIGTWELRTSSGTILGFIHNYPPGNGNTITFLDGSRYESVYANADTISTGGGTYQLSTRSDCSENPVGVISYSPENFVNAISVSNDTLYIGSYCISDGVSNVYVKIK